MSRRDNTYRAKYISCVAPHCGLLGFYECRNNCLLKWNSKISSRIKNKDYL